MAKKTKTFRLNSTEINREFLEKLGKIIESDKGEKDKISYNINSKDEEINVSSMKELLEIGFLPHAIKSMVFRISPHYSNENKIEIYLRVDKIEGSTCQISSEDDSKILKIEKDIINLFDTYRTWQSYVYRRRPTTMLYIAAVVTISLLILLSPLVTQVKNFNLRFFLGLIGAPLYISLCFLLNYLYPYNEFNLEERKSIKIIFKGLLWLFFITLFGCFINKIINFLLS